MQQQRQQHDFKCPQASTPCLELQHQVGKSTLISRQDLLTTPCQVAGFLTPTAASWDPTLTNKNKHWPPKSYPPTLTHTQVAGFLTPTAISWDPTLAFVMGGALLVALPGAWTMRVYCSNLLALRCLLRMQPSVRAGPAAANQGQLLQCIAGAANVAVDPNCTAQSVSPPPPR